MSLFREEQYTIKSCDIFCPSILESSNKIKNFWFYICITRQKYTVNIFDTINPCISCSIGKEYLNISKFGNKKYLDNYVSNILANNSILDIINFKIGDNVMWISVSFGINRINKGRIVQVVKKGQLPNRKWKNLYTGHGCGGKRSKESYVIQVQKNNRIKYYWPYINKLLKIEE